MSQPIRTFYLAGDLFNYRMLAGNAWIAQHIMNQSTPGEKWKVLLPQLVEPRDQSGAAIRNADLELLIKADAAVFIFDGLELDSGIVAEYIFAKMCDIPSVLVRTDLRGCGEHPECPWNLMLGFYPRCHIVKLNAMDLYKKSVGQAEEGRDSNVDNPLTGLDEVGKAIGGRIAEALNVVSKERPVMPAHLRKSVYEWVRLFPGSGFEGLVSARQLDEVLARRFGGV
jgi:nucleoside 2-deoxyribosyltransferase